MIIGDYVKVISTNQTGILEYKEADMGRVYFGTMDRVRYVGTYPDSDIEECVYRPIQPEEVIRRQAEEHGTKFHEIDT
jgi:hypothetical protein